MKITRAWLYVGVFGLMANTIFAEDAILNKKGPVAGNILTDAAQFVKDSDTELADDAAVGADRDAMVVDLNNATALRTDVLKFFQDRASSFVIDVSVILDRRQFRVDVKPQTGPLQKAPVGSSDLTTAVQKFQTDFNARVAAEAAIDVDFANLQVSVLQLNAAAVTTNGNAYFHDRFSYFQNRIYEAADVVNIKKIVKFKPERIALTRPAKGKQLMVHVQQFLTDRATWLTDEAAIAAARNNMFASIGTSSFEATVTTWLNARHAHYVQGLQLAVDRQAMKVDVGLAKPEKVSGLKAQGKAEGAEDSLSVPDADLDQSDEDNGEK